ncbi:MAG: hypothetical protein ACOH5I_19700 [Oligoflexus sp.]
MKIYPPSDPEVFALQQAFEQWRSNRKKGARIPDKLWTRAAQLADKHRPSMIAKLLNLDANHHKKRMDKNRARQSSKIEVVKLPPIKLGKATAPSSSRVRPSSLVAELTTRIRSTCWDLFWSRRK